MFWKTKAGAPENSIGHCLEVWTIWSDGRLLLFECTFHTYSSCANTLTQQNVHVCVARNDNTFKCGESICAVAQKRKAWDYSLMRLLPLLPLPSVVGDSLADKTAGHLCTMKMQKVQTTNVRFFGPLANVVPFVRAGEWGRLISFYCLMASAKSFRHLDTIDHPSILMCVVRCALATWTVWTTAHDDEVQSSKGENRPNANDRSLDYAHSTETSTWIAFVWKTSLGRIEIDQKRKENGWQFQWANAARIH